MTRTRFAPSPTGYLHIGGARTALFCWLFSKQSGGKFVLRIEDTDRERSTDASVEAILQSMQWLGLDYDEGPFYQTQRFDRYQQVINQLLETGHAYYCSCSKERLESLRESQMQNKEKPRYDGCCLEKGLKPGDAESMVIRFRNPQQGTVVFEDQVKGSISVANCELDDLIIQRSDGTPTYNLSVVVDDWDMKITHVIRGDDHVNNTPRQINILKALGADIPVYAHVPMILGSDGKRLSKRHGAVSVMQYFDEGYLPDALINYLVRLGWSHGDQELFTREQMIEYFSLDSINRAASTFNPEKLDWINQQYLKSEPVEKITSLVRESLQSQGLEVASNQQLEQIVELYRERVKTLRELESSIRYFFAEFEDYDPKAVKKAFKPAAVEALLLVKQQFDELEDWNRETIHQAIVQVTEELQVGMGKVGQPLRVAVTGGSFSPPIDETVWMIGKQRVIERIDRAIVKIQQSSG